MTSLPPIDKKRSNSYTNPQTQTRKRTVSEPPVAINQDKDIMQELLDQRKQILTRKQEKSILVHIGYFVVTIGMLVVQFRDRNSLNFFIQWNEYFSTAKFAFPGLPGIPFSTLDFCGSLMACRRYRIAIRLQRGRKSWFETLVASTLLQFGGTTLTGMFLGQIPSWTLGNHVFVALLLAWWLTFFSPFDIYWKLTKNSNLFYFSVGSLAAIGAGHAVGSWGVDQAMYNALHNNSSKMSRSVFVCLVCGSLSGSGGKLLNDVLGITRKTYNFTMTQTPIFFQMNYNDTCAVLNRSFLLAVVYYSLVNVHDFLPWGQVVTREVGHILLAMIQILNFYLSTYDPELDIFTEITTFLLGMLNISSIDFSTRS